MTYKFTNAFVKIKKTVFTQLFNFIKNFNHQMKSFKLIIWLSLSLWFAIGSTAQNIKGFQTDESILYSMNKQVGQFVRRFNMEEDDKGKFLLKSDKRYHNNKMRSDILPSMFDKSNARTSGNLKTYFIDDVTNSKNPTFLNFLDKDWYAEVSATFYAEGQEVNIILYLTLEEENLGSKWIISNVYYSYFPNLFPEADTLEKAKYFLHPQSHELDFMNLHKALDDPGHIEYYASKEYSPDYLTLFFYQMKKGKLKFKEINTVKFHFFQIKNWYFELSYFNRNNSNSGWLISNLIYVEDKQKQELIKTYRLCSLRK